jgi:hypothetical protein
MIGPRGVKFWRSGGRQRPGVLACPMPRLALFVALCLACAGEDVESNFPDPSGLYRVEADGPACDGGAVEVGADAVICRWECLSVDGEDVRSVALTFRREEGEPWRLSFAAWDFGVCD